MAFNDLWSSSQVAESGRCGDRSLVGLDHIVVNTPDMERAMRFYHEVLGLELLRLEESRAGKVGFVSARLSGTGSVSCNSVFVLHLCCFLNQEELMKREAMVQHP